MADEPKVFDPEQQQRTSHREVASAGSSEGSPRAPPYAEHGPLIDRSETAELRTDKKSMNKALAWPRIRHMLREPFSEFMVSHPYCP